MIPGSGDEKIAIEAMKLGAGDYLVKDVNNGYLDLVPVVIEQLLKQRRLIKERQQATAAIKIQNRRLSLLNRLGQGLSATLKVEQILRQLLPAATEIVDAEASSVWLWTGDRRQSLRCVAVVSHRKFTPDPKVTVEVSQGSLGWIAQNGRGMFANDVASNPERYTATGVYRDVDVNSVLGVPLLAHETVIGVLEVTDYELDHFKQNELALVE